MNRQPSVVSHQLYSKIKGSRWSLVVLTGLMFFTLAVPAFAANIVQNWDFEIGTLNNNDAVTSWTTYDEGLPGGVHQERNALGSASGAVNTGTRCLRLDCANLPNNRWAGAFQDLYGIYEGDLIIFSAFACTPNLAVASAANIQLEFYDRNGGLLTRATSVNINVGNALGPPYVQFTVSGKAPPNTNRVRFIVVSAIAAGAGGAIDFDTLNGTLNEGGIQPNVDDYPVAISLRSSTYQASVGDVITFTADVTNRTAATINNVETVLDVPLGLDLIKESVRLNGQPVNIREGSFIFDIATLGPGETKRLVFQLLVSSGVQINHRYAVNIFARNSVTLAHLSDNFEIPILIIPDPVFDLGTIIGKVFHDTNENGVQDKDEPGVPDVRIATEQGVVVYTDKEGKYHIPGVTPGRHIVKIDGHTLPKGTKFITEESYLTKITNGIMAKVNFAVLLPEEKVPEEYRKDLTVRVTEEVDRINPEISVAVFPSILKMGQGVFEKVPTIRLHTNYGNLVHEWRVEIRDEVGHVVWSGYGSGVPPSEVQWNGKNEFGEPVKPGDYAARFIVADKTRREDWSPLALFRILDKKDPAHEGLADLEEAPFSQVGYFNIVKDGKRSIPVITRGAVKVRGRASGAKKVKINGRDVAIDKDGKFEEKVYLPYGENQLEIDAVGKEGKVVSYTEPVKVNDSYYFMAALAEGELGYNHLNHGIRTVAKDDNYKNAFYQDGKVAYYLKGKIKGRFLVTSSYDTSKVSGEGSNLFTNLDPDKYYPIYGDASTITYDGGETQDKLYVLVETDKAFLKVGSFKTDFKETQLATHDRTMSGIKGHYETLSTTKYGDSKAHLVFFKARENQKPAHDEMLGTGGSLYYLSHRILVEGSEKVSIEVRDKYTKMVLSSTQLANGTDYEINYGEGRLILNSPLNSVSASDTIISNALLNGNEAFLVVNYEYQQVDFIQNTTSGVRGYYNYGNNIRVGGTYIEDTRATENTNYHLAGIDGLVRFGENTRVLMEYAESLNSQQENNFSNDGGLTYTDINAITLPNADNDQRKRAYMVKGETKLGPKTDLSAYFQKITPGFSNADLAAQQGYEKYGFAGTYRFNSYLRFDVRHDRRKSTDWGNVSGLATSDVGEVDYTTVKGSFRMHPLFIDAEYCHQSVQEYHRGTSDYYRLRPLARLLDLNTFENAVGGRIAYQLTEDIKPYIRGQATAAGESNNQFAAGIEAKICEKSKVTFEEVVGSIGDATLLHFQTQVSEDTQTYADYAIGEDNLEGPGYNVAIGATTRIDKRSRIISERRYSGYQGENAATSLYGYERTFLDGRLGFKTTFERSQINDIVLSDRTREAYRNAGTIGISYNDNERLSMTSKLELRLDDKSTTYRQWLSYHTFEFKANKDLTLGGRLNFSNSRNTTDSDLAGRFVECNLGFAYRPVDWDRFNMLARYTYLEDVSLDTQYDSVATDQSSHIFATDFAYDINSRLQLVEKLAWKMGIYSSEIAGPFDVYTSLWVSRFNFHITKKWDVAIEYRTLFQRGSGHNLRQGALVEVDREILDHIRLGVGYNFTDFSDDLRHSSDYDRQGVFSRLTGKF